MTTNETALQSLHIVTRSPHGSDALGRCLQSVAQHDGVLLIEDGVYGSAILADVVSTQTIKAYVLQADLEARHQRPNGLEIIDYDGFVQLCAQYSKTISWF